MWKSLHYMLIFFFTYINSKAIGQEQLNNMDVTQKVKAFETFVENIVKCRKVTGAAITMVKENEVLFKKGFGYENISKGILATENTKFCIGSLTKAFTSTLLAKLLDKQDTINWDTPIKDIVGNSFRLTDSLRTNNVNLRDLLSHKVGIPSFFNALLVGFPENMTRERFVRNLEHLPAVKPFRTKFIYSNYMYTLAGYVAEKIGHKSWENLVNEMLLKPLGMCRSGFVDKVSDFEGFAVPYSFRNGSAVALDMMLTQSVHPLGPAGSIYSTADDMGKWIIYHLDELQKLSGKNTSVKDNILETYRSQMPTPFQESDWYKPTHQVDDISVSYDMGWITSSYRGFRRFWHTGGIVTYSSYLGLYPDKHSGVFISLTGSENNDNSLPMKAISCMASDLLLDVPPWLNITSACSTPAPWIIKEKQSPKVDRNIPLSKKNFTKIDDFEGFYGHPAFGKIYVKTENDSSVFLEYGRFGRMKLLPISKGEFIAYFVDLLWYLTDADGKSSPYKITFVYSKHDSVTGLMFPIDPDYKRIFFRKNCNPDDKNSLKSGTTNWCVTSVCNVMIANVQVIMICIVSNFLNKIL